jgi:hypothetical protein
MLYSEIIAVCSEIHTKHINTLCGQNVEFVNVKPGGTYTNHWALNGQERRNYHCLNWILNKCDWQTDDWIHLSQNKTT